MLFSNSQTNLRGELSMHASQITFRRLLNTFLTVILLISGAISPTTAFADHTTDPASVTIAGSLQSELGCAGDWDPACANTHLTYEAGDDVWHGTWTVPAGSWEYKAPLNDNWTESYGLNGQNIPLNLGASASVKFYYDHKSHWVTDSVNSRIATAPGSYQDEIGCSGDWQPDCLRSWLQDPDGDGTYTFTTTAIPQGSYEFKVAIDEGWDENYGSGGSAGGANIPFTVTAAGTAVTFSFNSASNMPGVDVASSGSQLDNNVEWDGLRHNSRDLLYRTPGGAVPAGTDVRLRFRTFHNDVSAVSLRLFNLNTNASQVIPMTRAAEDVSCYETGFDGATCDFWEAVLDQADPNNFWYRFIVTDGTDTDYYADNTPALDGGLGSTTEDAVDYSYALMFHDPSFSAPAWAEAASIYQIFPDRFRNGRTNNDPKTNDIRYDDPALKLPWGILPEGFCRNYADADTNCPWRFD